MSNKYLQALNLFSYLILVVFNFLAVRLPFFGRRPGDVSDMYPTPFTPPDFSFKIWIVLYTLLGISIFHQSKGLFQKESTVQPETKNIGLLFSLTCIFNMGWLVTWQSLHLTLAFFMLFFLWATLIVIYYRLAPFSRNNWYYTLPFSAYLGWVAVTSLSNLYVTLAAGGFEFWGLSSLVLGMSCVILAIFGGLLVLKLNNDWWFNVIVVWAFLGICIKNEMNQVGIAALAGIFILSVGILFTAYRNYKRTGSVNG